MGRAQGLLADQFTNVLGVRRGVSSEQEALATAPSNDSGIDPGLFSADPQEARRLMLLAQWWLEHNTSPLSPKQLIKQSGVYVSPVMNYSGDGWVDLCLQDIKALVDLGIVEDFGEKEITHQSRVIYRNTGWPSQHQETFFLWQEATKAKLLLESKSFSMSYVQACRMMKLVKWLLDYPHKVGVISNKNGYSPATIIRKSGIYDDLTPKSFRGRNMSTMLLACEDDLDLLHGKDIVKLIGGTSPSYIIETDIRNKWPQSNEEAYFAWQDAGCPSE